MVLEGGFLTQPHVIASCSFPGSDGRDVECVAVGKTEGWLAEAATGRHVSTRVLGNSNVFKKMREQFMRLESGTCGCGGDGMDELAYGAYDFVNTATKAKAITRVIKMPRKSIRGCGDSGRHRAGEG